MPLSRPFAVSCGTAYGGAREPDSGPRIPQQCISACSTSSCCSGPSKLLDVLQKSRNAHLKRRGFALSASCVVVASTGGPHWVALHAMRVRPSAHLGHEPHFEMNSVPTMFHRHVQSKTPQACTVRFAQTPMAQTGESCDAREFASSRKEGRPRGPKVLGLSLLVDVIAAFGASSGGLAVACRRVVFMVPVALPGINPPPPTRNNQSRKWTAASWSIGWCRLSRTGRPGSAMIGVVSPGCGQGAA